MSYRKQNIYIKCWISGLGGCDYHCPPNCGTKRCRVKGCTYPKCIIDALPHYCNLCKNKDSKHFSKNCHYKKIFNNYIKLNDRFNLLIKLFLFLLITMIFFYIQL